MENTNKDIIDQVFENMGAFKDVISESSANKVTDDIRRIMNEAIEDEDVDKEDENPYDETDVDAALDNDENKDGESDEIEIVDDENDSSDVSPLDNETPPLDLGEDGEGESDVEILDMTSKSDDEVISVYKKMSDSDEIEIIDDEVKITDPESGNEYKIELNSDTPEAPADIEADIEVDDTEGDSLGLDSDDLASFSDDDSLEDDTKEDSEFGDNDGEGSEELGDTEDNEENTDSEEEEEDDEEVIFEVELDQSVNEETLEEDGEKNNEAIEEQIPVGIGQDHRLPSTNAKEAGIVGAGASEEQLNETIANLQAELKALKEQNESLVNTNEKYKEVVTKFNGMISEAKIQTNKMAAIAKVYLVGSTTQNEKIEIFNQISETKTINETNTVAKNLIQNYASSKKSNINEVLDKTSSAQLSVNVDQKNTINESKSPEHARMLTLMHKENNNN